MRRTVLAFYTVFAVTGSSFGAYAQVGEIAGGLATEQVISSISQKLNGLIDNARQSGDFLAMRGAQEALYVLDAFGETSKEILDKSFENIGKERQAVLNALNKTAASIEAGRIDTLERLQASGDQLDRLARDVTFKEFPVLYRYRGTVVTPGENADVRVVIDGHRLTRGEPYLLLRDKKYPAKIDGESLRFDLPRTLFKEEADKSTFEDATLVVENREGGFFGWFQDVSEKKYDLSFVTLPATVATVTAKYKEVIDLPQERAFQEEVNHNSSSRNWNCRPFIYSPASANRRFDLSRSSVREYTGNSRGQIRNIQVRDVGISFELCARRGVFDKDNGYRHAIVNYVEVWNDETSQDRETTQALLWTASSTIALPARTSDLIIEVKDFNGISRVVTEAGGQVGKYATVRFDAQANLIIVDPVQPAFVGAL